MATGTINKSSVDATHPAAKDVYLWDDELAGFGIKVTPAGRKVYLVQYRIGGRNGRTRRATIGVHGTFTPAQARTEAKRMLGEVAAGRDPSTERDKRRADQSLKALLDRFMDEHVKPKLKPSTAREYERLKVLYIDPKLGSRRAGEIQRADVAKLHLDMADMSYQANRTLALLSKCFNWAEKHGLRPQGQNPCRHIEKYKEARRERFLSPAELGRLGEALREAETDKTATPWAIAAIRLLSLTGARLSEILTLRWEYFSEQHRCLILPDSKTGQKIIHLNAPALAVLEQIPRLERNPFVICGEKEKQHLVNLQKPWRRIRKKANLTDVRLHDLRHSFASVAAAGGQSLVVIGKLLGHSQPTTTARYSHLADDPVRAAGDAIAEQIAAALDGRKTKVVKLGKTSGAGSKRKPRPARIRQRG